MTKRRTVKLSKLREIGWTLWDPIGLLESFDRSDEDFPKDEYDRYLLTAYGKFGNGASTEEVSDYLFNISSEYMGLGESIRLRLGAEATATKIFENLDSLT